MINPQSTTPRGHPNPQLAALLADLHVLDGRIERAIERVRQTLPDDADPAHRGLVIEENDVDMWLSTLANPDHGGSESATAAEALAHEDGRLASLGRLFGLGALEKAMLLTALAPEVDLSYAHLYSYVQDDVTRKYATLELASSLW